MKDVETFPLQPSNDFNHEMVQVGTISSPYEYYLEWKDPSTDISELGENPNSQQILLKDY